MTCLAFFNLSKRTQNEPKQTQNEANLNPNKPFLSILVGFNLSHWRWFQASFCVPWGRPFPAGGSFSTNFGLIRLLWWSPAPVTMATLVGLKMNTVPRCAPAARTPPFFTPGMILPRIWQIPPRPHGRGGLPIQILKIAKQTQIKIDVKTLL